MMDAIAIGCTCRQPVHFTIRSDMFNNKLFNFLLKRLPLSRVLRLGFLGFRLRTGRRRRSYTGLLLCQIVLQLRQFAYRRLGGAQC